MSTTLSEDEVRLLVSALQTYSPSNDYEAKNRSSLIQLLHPVKAESREKQVGVIKGSIAGSWASWRFDPAKFPEGEFNIRPVDGTIEPMNPGKDARVRGSGSLGIYAVQPVQEDKFAIVTIEGD